MALVDVVLRYRPYGLAGDAIVTVGAVEEPGVLRSVRDALLERARDEAQVWQGVDAGLATFKFVELERLTKLMAVLLPEEPPKPTLRVLRRGAPEAETGGSPTP